MLSQIRRYSDERVAREKERERHKKMMNSAKWEPFVRSNVFFFIRHARVYVHSCEHTRCSCNRTGDNFCQLFPSQFLSTQMKRESIFLELSEIALHTAHLYCKHENFHFLWTNFRFDRFPLSSKEFACLNFLNVVIQILLQDVLQNNYLVSFFFLPFVFGSVIVHNGSSPWTNNSQLTIWNDIRR